MESPKPLPADSKRQAAAMLRGCEYQVWQTVSAWCDLSPKDVLFVEGAEDFDVIGPAGAEAVQVKAGAETISLGREDAQVAINHFWQLRARRQNGGLRFRFLTRSRIVPEDNPFGRGIAGLDLWMRREISDGDVKKIADYLATRDRLDADFRQWLQNGSVREVRDFLLAPFTWETRAEAVEFVERAVMRKVNAMAAKKRDAVSVSPSVTRRVVRRLFDEVWKVLRRTDFNSRFLDSLRIEELWEEAGSEAGRGTTNTLWSLRFAGSR